MGVGGLRVSMCSSSFVLYSSMQADTLSKHLISFAKNAILAIFSMQKSLNVAIYLVTVNHRISFLRQVVPILKQNFLISPSQISPRP